MGQEPYKAWNIRLKNDIAFIEGHSCFDLLTNSNFGGYNEIPDFCAYY